MFLVVETSVGLDRMFLAVLLLLKEETLEDGSTRTVLKLPSVLAPTKAAILPLVKRRITRNCIKSLMILRWDFNVSYDEKRCGRKTL
jgi:glycyl-tRNA synthetase